MWWGVFVFKGSGSKFWFLGSSPPMTAILAQATKSTFTPPPQAPIERAVSTFEGPKSWMAVRAIPPAPKKLKEPAALSPHPFKHPTLA